MFKNSFIFYYFGRYRHTELYFLFGTGTRYQNLTFSWGNFQKNCTFAPAPAPENKNGPGQGSTGTGIHGSGSYSGSGFFGFRFRFLFRFRWKMFRFRFRYKNPPEPEQFYTRYYEWPNFQFSSQNLRLKSQNFHAYGAKFHFIDLSSHENAFTNRKKFWLP